MLSKQRRGDVVKRELDKFFVARWRNRPITAIDRRDVLEVINETIDRGAQYQAHNLLGHVRALFNWACEQPYGLDTSPCDRIRPKRLIGERKPRQRVLTDPEIKAFWTATGSMGYPFGPLFRLLLLTGCRKSEIADARWREIDKDQRMLAIPAERFKSYAQHLVPLTKDAMAILVALPTFNKADYIFTRSFGMKPAGGFSDAKETLDDLMTKELGEKLKPFRTHDLRRTVRTKLSALKVSREVAELVIGHGKRELDRVYDQHEYLDEMREALELWAARLRES